MIARFKNLSSVQKGICLAFTTAIISGFSVYLNKFAIVAIPNSHVFTTAKNIIVALLFSLIIFTPCLLNKLKSLNKREWLKLILIGVIGGSIPFLLFFKGLSLSTSANSAFIHKTLFIWVAFLAIPLLKEKLSKAQLGAVVLLIFGNLILTKLKFWRFNTADLLILAATMFWAVEYIIAKKTLQNIPASIVSWARMFFGAIILIIFLLITSQASGLLNLTLHQWSWVGLSSALLFGYVFTWYNALQKLPATIVTSILVIASPITTLLNNIFSPQKYTQTQIAGSLLVLLTIMAISYLTIHSQKHAESAAKTS